FIDSAKQESIDTILEMAEHKKDGACRRLIVTGCMAERYRDELKKEIPEIDAVLGTGEVPQIVGAIAPGAAPLPLYRRDQLERVSSGRGAKTFAERPMRSRRADPRLKPSRYMKSENAPAPSPQPPGPTGMREAPTYIYDADTPRLFATPRHYAYVKIAE